MDTAIYIRNPVPLEIALHIKTQAEKVSLEHNTKIQTRKH